MRRFTECLFWGVTIFLVAFPLTQWKAIAASAAVLGIVLVQGCA